MQPESVGGGVPIVGSGGVVNKCLTQSEASYKLVIRTKNFSTTNYFSAKIPYIYLLKLKIYKLLQLIGKQVRR